MKYLELYELIHKAGNIDIYHDGSASGLCDIIGMELDENAVEEFVDLMHPEELRCHRGRIWYTYWAGPNTGEFTPLRQNLLLLMAAINNEL